jgi:type I restriction enzyme S subunit
MQNEWQEKPLSSLCLYLNRGAAPAYTDTAGILVLNQKCVRDQRVDFSQARRTDSQKKPVAADRLIQKFDILVNSTGVGTLGRVAQVHAMPEIATVDSHVTLVRPDPKAIDPLYLGLAIRCFESEIEALGEGSTGQTELSRARLGTFSIPMPTSLGEQRAIAHILGTLDEKIELNRNQNNVLETMAHALFKAWFVDFEPVRAKLEGRWQRGRSLPGLPAHLYELFPDRLVESEFGEIPEGWDISTLGDVCSYLNRGISPKYIDLGGVSVLNQKCIRDFSIDFSKARRHDVAQKKIEGRALELGDVLVNSTGVGTLGRVAQVRRLVETTIVDSHVTVIRSGPRINPMYLGCFMSMKQSEIEAMGEGSTGQTELSRTKLGNLKILIPTSDALNLLAKQTNAMSEKLAANQKESEILAQIRDTLMPKLISGELRLSYAERLIGAAV